MSGENFDNVTVLIVDDNQHMRTLLVEILHALGIRRIVHAGDGGHAIRLMVDQEIDLVFTDCAMRPMDGLTFVKLLRTSSASPSPFVPIIMLTGHSTRQIFNHARMAGVTEFLTKPVTPVGVLHRINEILHNPRPFVRTQTYFGPCRRRKIDHEYGGPERRTHEDETASVY